MQIRILCFTLSAALAFLPLAPQAATMSESIPDFGNGEWEVQEIKPWSENPAFTITLYNRFSRDGKTKEGGMTLRYGDIHGEVVLKGWGIIFQNGEPANMKNRTHALHLENDAWVVGKRGEPFDWKIDSGAEGNFFVLLVVTENGFQGRAFQIQHVT